MTNEIRIMIQKQTIILLYFTILINKPLTHCVL